MTGSPAPVAMILAAGRGERMRPLSDRTPKPLLEAGGKPLIFRHLEKLAAAGFETVIVNHAHLGEQIEAAVGDGSRWGLQVRYSPEIEALESAGGVRKALRLIRVETFAVVNSDVHSDYDYAGLAAAAAQLARIDRLAHLVLVDNPPHRPQGDFRLDEGLVHDSGSGRLTFSGLGAYRAALFASMRSGIRHALAPLLREQMANDKISGEHFRGRWTDVGTPERLAQLDVLLRSEQQP